MLKLYYGPGAGSLASHIVLEEVGASYEPCAISLADGQQRQPEFLRINHRGRVPALETPFGILTENVAIMLYLARSHPDARLLPDENAAQARCLSMLAWMATTVHPAFSHVRRPERFTDDASAFEGISRTGRSTFWSALGEIEAQLGTNAWLQGEHYTLCDAYALVFYAWAARTGMPVADLARFTAWKERMIARSAVRKVLVREGSPLLQT